MTSLNSAAHGVKNYAYSGIGNILTNQDFGSGTYQYGAKPHAVTNANGTVYGYDPCGNMVTRGAQTLTYDEQNQLVRVSTGTTNVLFGYAEGGQRLWRCGTNGYSVWIGGIYEINNGKVLCHVFAGGQRVATFEPLCGGPWARAIGEQRWYACSTALAKILVWPLQNGRGPFAFLAFAWLSIAVICKTAGAKSRPRAARRRCRTPSRKATPCYRPAHSLFPIPNLLSSIFRLQSSIFHFLSAIYYLRLRSLWSRSVTFLSISALLLATTPNAAAQSDVPTFYYYHADSLGSSNVLSNRSGAPVQHYEYSTFGQSTFTSSTSAFPVSNRYTGQILDDETGLYYYNARYYDPQLGRFIQADTIIPGPTNPQALNRYSYVFNNPLNAIDPTGHGFWGGLGKSLGDAFSHAFKNPQACTSMVLGGPAGLIMFTANTIDDYLHSQLFGSETAGYMSAARTIVLGLVEIIGGACTGNGFAVLAGALSIAQVGAQLAGDRELATDLGWAAIGASVLAMGYTVSRAYSAFGDTPVGHVIQQFSTVLARAFGYFWNLPNDVIGLMLGGLGYLIGWVEYPLKYALGWSAAPPAITPGHNGIQFENNPLMFGGDITLGNVMNFRAPGFLRDGSLLRMGPDDPLWENPKWTYGEHEMQHTFQGMILGPLYLPAYGLGMVGALFKGQGIPGMFGPGNFMETGPSYPELHDQAPRIF